MTIALELVHGAAEREPGRCRVAVQVSTMRLPDLRSARTRDALAHAHDRPHGSADPARRPRTARGTVVVDGRALALLVVAAGAWWIGQAVWGDLYVTIDASNAPATVELETLGDLSAYAATPGG